MTEYEALGQEIAAKQAAWFDLYQHPENFKEFDAAGRVAELQRRDTELGALQTRWEPLHAIEQKAAQVAQALADHRTPAPVVPFPGGGETKSAAPSLGRAFTTHPAYKGFRPGASQTIAAELADAQFKTTMTTAAGFAPANYRMDTMVFSAQRTPMLEDYLPSTTVTERNSTSFMEETTFTNTAAARAEGSAATDATLAFTQRNQPIELVSVSLPVTDQQLGDVGSIEAVIDQRLRLMVAIKTEVDLLTANGSTPNLQGILTKSGIQTQALGSDDQPSAIYRAMTLVRVTGRARPSLIILHPNDMQEIVLLKDADGNFIFGGPNAATPDRLWGLPVLVTDAETENTGIVLDTSFLMINNRQGVTVAITNSHASEFLSGIQHIRLDRRLNLEIWRAAAICTVTGL